MSDQIYATDEWQSSENFVTIAQACRGVLTKRNFADGTQLPYDHVKLFNFDEVQVNDLRDLYALSISMLNRYNCCFIRARIKDEDNCRGVVRKCNGEEATLVLEKCNWFALDIDWKEEPSSGNIKIDCETVLLALPSFFQRVQYFAVASASYLFKPGIRMRMFFWADEPVSGIDLKNAIKGYEKITDPAIFNPIQPIYTAAPIGVNPIQNRVYWKQYLFGTKELHIPITDYQHSHGMPEIWYSKKRAIKNAEKHIDRIGMLSPGGRHDGLFRECIALGKLVGQGHFEREAMIDRCFEECSIWVGKRDTKKDMATIIAAIDRGIAAMDRGN